MQLPIPTCSLDAVSFASPHPETLAEFYQHGFELGAPKWLLATEHSLIKSLVYSPWYKPGIHLVPVAARPDRVRARDPHGVCHKPG
jgi:hypothetical protein